MEGSCIRADEQILPMTGYEIYRYEAFKRRIPDFCSIPRTRKELEQHFSEVAIEYPMSKTVKPLLAAEKPELTLPEKPRSQCRKYFTRQD